jgi:hypothetical protein
MNDIGSVVAIAAIAITVIVNAVSVSRWCGRMETRQERDHKAMFDSDDTPKWDSIRDDVTWIRGKLGNGLFKDVECLKNDSNDFRERLSHLEAVVGGRRKTNGVHRD